MEARDHGRAWWVDAGRRAELLVFLHWLQGLDEARSGLGEQP